MNHPHTVGQGSSCEDRQEDQHHKESHKKNDSDCSLRTESSTQTSVKATPPINYMGEEPKERGLVGLANLGNTCYLNSTIQALRNTTELTAFFLEGRHEDFMKGKSETTQSVILTKAYADLLKCTWDGHRSQYIRPVGFFNDMCKAVDDTMFEQFKMKIAHDSHEFLMFMLDNLHSSLAEEVNITITRPPPSSESEVMIQKALEFWRDMFRKSYSPLIDLLFGLYQREMHCQTCNKKTYTYETFNCLKVGMPEARTTADPVDLDTLLKEELKEETIEGYACDHCAPTRCPAIRRTRLWKLPKILFVALKRFTPIGTKITTPFKMDIDTEMPFEQHFSPETPEPSRHKKYSLFATIDHFGSTHGGHYTSQAKNPLTGKWHGYDDESVYDLEKPSVGNSTYIVCLRATS